MQAPHSLQPLGNAEKKRLYEAIAVLQVQHAIIGKKIDGLEEKLEPIKKTFLSRIRSLYTTIDQLNQKISYYKKIESLVDGGMTFQEAKKKVNEQEKKDKRKEAQQSKNDEYIFILEDKIELPETNGIMLKELYRKLTRKFHPDLVQDIVEKKKREDMMKKINAAFADKNMNVLTQIDEEESAIDYEHVSIEFLKKKLVQFLHLLDMMKKEYQALLRSEWNTWRKKFEKEKRLGIDVFLDLEKSLAEEIRKKKIIIDDYNNAYEKK